MTAHQRLIRERMASLDPRGASPSLDGYRAAQVSISTAWEIITRYEWLGTIGRPTACIGLIAPSGEVEGVACFGYGPHGHVRNVIGEPALCLERGACVHYAPRNAASFLITAACKLVYTATGIERFFAYGDPEAGEYGGVYQACGWAYLGQGILSGKQRAERYMVLAPGAEDIPANWKTTRALRQGPLHLSWEEARALGWRVERRAAKHIYATHVGKDRKAWRAGLRTYPYPAPRPELKMSISGKSRRNGLDVG